MPVAAIAADPAGAAGTSKPGARERGSQRPVDAIGERQPRHGGTDAQRAQTQDVALDGDEIGKALDGGPLRQPVAMAGPDRDRPVQLHARGAPADQPCDRAVLGRDRKPEIIGREQVGGAPDRRRLMTRRQAMAQTRDRMRRAVPSPARGESEDGAAEQQIDAGASPSAAAIRARLSGAANRSPEFMKRTYWPCAERRPWFIAS